MLIPVELMILGKLKDQVRENPEIPKWLNEKLLETEESKFSKEVQDKAFKTAFEVQKLLAPHIQ